MASLAIRLFPVDRSDCIAIRFPDDSFAVVDCGATLQQAHTILRYLNIENRAKKPIRFVLGTHPDADHIGDMRLLLNGCSAIGAVYHCGVDREVDGGTVATAVKRFLEDANRLQKEGKIGIVRPLVAGDTIPLEPPIDGVEIRVLHPDAERVARGSVRKRSDCNNCSVVLLISYAGTITLLGGDIDEHAWQNVAAHPDFLGPDVLKVPHHGAKNSLPAERAIAGRTDNRVCWALLSTPSKSLQHPSPEVLEVLRRLPFWRIRCTGWSPLCSQADQEWSPPEPDDVRYPESLRYALAVQYRAVGSHAGEKRLRCCLDNEVTIDAGGNIAHSRSERSCDERLVPFAV